MKIVGYYFVYIFFSHTFIADTLLNFPNATKNYKTSRILLDRRGRTLKMDGNTQRLPSLFGRVRTHDVFSFICSVRFLFAAYFFCLRRSFFICSVSLLFAVFLFYLQRFFFVYSVSLVGHRSNVIYGGVHKLNKMTHFSLDCIKEIMSFDSSSWLLLQKLLTS